jgi:hypothetical protein
MTAFGVSTVPVPAAAGGSATPSVGLCLADEFFLIAHDEHTGRPQLRGRVTGFGLAGALLAELVLFGRITVEGDRLYVLEESPPANAVAHLLLEELRAEPAAAAVRDWLIYLGGRAYDLVGGRLLRAGHLNEVPVRRRLRPGTVYVPVDVNAAAWPAAALWTALARREAMGHPQATLAGLVVATGLHRHLRWDDDVATEQVRRYLVRPLPGPLRCLVEHVDAAVGDAVLAARA